jgi:cell division protein FtsB
MTEDLTEKFFRYFTFTLIVAIFVGGICFAYPTYVRTQNLKRENAKLSERIEEKRKEIAKLVDNQRRFRTDPDFVEKIARENKRVYPGELVFVFEKE